MASSDPVHYYGLAPPSDHSFAGDLQPERTALAWRGTSPPLSYLYRHCAYVVTARRRLGIFGAWALSSAGPGVLIAVIIAGPSHLTTGNEVGLRGRVPAEPMGCYGTPQPPSAET